MITIVSNDAPTTAPLITATLTESSPLSLDGTLDTTVAKVNIITNYKLATYLVLIALIPLSGLTESSSSSAMTGVVVTRVYDDVTVGDGVGVAVWTV